jgi:excisionase family DNA binding protein
VQALARRQGAWREVLGAMMVDRPFSPKQLAERWGVTVQHVHKLIRKGTLKHFRIGEKLLRIPVEEVRRWEALQQPTQKAQRTTSHHLRSKGRTIEDAAFASVMASVRTREPPN